MPLKERMDSGLTGSVLVEKNGNNNVNNTLISVRFDSKSLYQAVFVKIVALHKKVQLD